MSDEPKFRTKRYALDVINLTLGLTRGVAAQVLAKQLLRSGTSIGANYREASRARSNAEFISSIGISLKEAEESLYWLELLGEARLGEPAVIEPLVRETEELCAILTTIAKKAKTRSE